MKSMHHSDRRLGTHLQLVLLILVGVVLLLSMYVDSFLEVEPLRDGGALLLETGWEISTEGKLLEKDLTLPFKIDDEVGGKTYQITRRLPEHLPNSNASLSIDTSMASLEVLIDGQSIYSYSGEMTLWKNPVLGGSFTHFVRLPDWAAGQKISMVMRFTSNNSFAGGIQPPQIGTKSDQILDQLRELPSIIFGIIFLFTGIVCSLTSLGLRKGKERESLWYFGWLEIALGSWVFTQNCAKLIFIRNPILPLNLSIFALFVLPYFLIQYIRSSYMIIDRKLKPFIFVSELFLIAYIIGGFAQYLGFFMYTDMLLLAGLSLVLLIICLFCVLLIDYIRGNRELLSFLLAIGVLLFTVLAEESLLLMSITLENAVILHVGMSLCGAILLSHSARFISKGNRSQMHEQMLLKLAFTDSLTGVDNRTAYTNRVEDVISRGSRSRVIGVLLIDVNDLKPINDKFGHATGDQLLKDVAIRITELLPDGTEIYRIGGDEFVSFIPNITKEQLALMCEAIHSQIFKIKDFQYTVACGYSLYLKEKTKSFTDVIAEADSVMYACKEVMKKGTLESD